MPARLSILLLLCVLSLSLSTCHRSPAYAVSDYVVSYTPLPQAKMPVLKIGEKEDPDVYLQSLDIQVEVTGNIASTRYTMIFKNKTDRILESELTFPLPEGRTVTHYALDVNDRMREAVPVEKAKATEVFEEIQNWPKVVDPGIMERVAGNNFRTRIYPFLANETRTITIGYEEELPLENNLLYYRLPMDYPNSLEKFSVKATVWKGSQKPLVPESENEISFDTAGENYVAAFSRENYRPSHSLIFALPVPSDIPQVVIQSAQEGNYFFASVVPKMETRKKQWNKDLAIIWDVSLSASQRNLQSEIEMLDIIFAENKKTNVHLYFLNNKLKKIGEYKELDKLKMALEAAIFDGGTDFSQINLNDIKGNEILFFSDGLSTLSDADFIKDSKSNRPVHCIVSSAKADYSSMKLIASKTKGKFVNINALSSKQLKSEVLNETLQFLGTEHGNNVSEVYPSIAMPVQGNFSVAGISGSGDAEFTLLFGFGNKVKKRVKIKLDAKNAASQGNIYKIWAQKKIAELDLNYEKNRTELTQLGKQFGIVTRGTSLMVLERIDDYLIYGIEPPASEPELLAAYQRIEERNLRRDEPKFTLLNYAIEAAKDLKEWRDTDCSDYKGSCVKKVENDFVSDSVLWDLIIWRSRIAGMPDKDEKTQPTITIKHIRNDSDYLSKLTGNIFDDYQIYLKLRNDYANSPTFYFDIAGWFYSLGDKETALRIITSIAELELENASLYKLLGYRFKEYGEFILQKFILQKVVQWRPMEPQSYRDYALALADNGEAQAALDSLNSLLAKLYSERIIWNSRAMAEAVVIEMNHLIAKNNLNTSNIDKRLITDIPVDVRIVINWNMNNTEIDLNIEGPGNEVGGRLSADVYGYGPEQFMLNNAENGKYKIYATYVGGRQFISTGPTTIMAEIFTKYADKTEQRKIVSFQLSNAEKEDEKKAEVAEFEFSENAVKAGKSAESKDPSKFGVKSIFINNGKVYLEMKKFTTPFYGIYMHFTDKNLNKESESYLEVRKAENGYAINKKYNVYNTLEKGLESYLKEYLEKMFVRVYKYNDTSWFVNNDVYWLAFVEEGKVQLFIDMVKSFLDDEFLSAPFEFRWE